MKPVNWTSFPNMVGVSGWKIECAVKTWKKEKTFFKGINSFCFSTRAEKIVLCSIVTSAVTSRMGRWRWVYQNLRDKIYEPCASRFWIDHLLMVCSFSLQVLLKLMGWGHHGITRYLTFSNGKCGVRGFGGGASRKWGINNCFLQLA